MTCEHADGVKFCQICTEAELEKIRARSERMAAGLRELYRTLPTGEHLGIVTGLMSDWHPWPETKERETLEALSEIAKLSPSEMTSKMDSAAFRSKLGEHLAGTKPQPVFKASPQKHVGLYFTAEDMAPGEVREVNANDNFGDVKWWTGGKIALTSATALTEWWLHDIKTSEGSRMPRHLKGKGCKLEPTSPIHDGPSLGKCDPRSVVLVIENRSKKRATCSCALLGFEAYVDPRTQNAIALAAKVSADGGEMDLSLGKTRK